ncbi:MAG: hypothetical protein R3Y05_05335 [bacterium]
MRELDHINMSVPNLEETINYYKIFGFKIIGDFQLGRRFVYISNGATTYELFEDKNLTQSVVGHIAYKSNDIQKDYNELKGKVEFTTGINSIDELWDNGVEYFLFKGINNEIIEYIKKR